MINYILIVEFGADRNAQVDELIFHNTGCREQL
jgi:hypothetical protein